MPVPHTHRNCAFSICIPCYNGREFLSETLESIRAQTHENWELIIVEDASPEPSRDIVEEFAASVTQTVRYLVSDTNQGTAVSRDIAINHATNPIISILDADDLWHPDHLASLAKTLADEKTDFAFSGFSMFLSDPEQPFLTRTPTAHDLSDLRSAYFFCRCWLPTGTIAFRRSILEKTREWAAGSSEKPSWLSNRDLSEDRNFLLRVIHSGIALKWTGEVTLAYRKHPSSMTGLSTNSIPYKVWYFNSYGLAPGIPISPQRRFLGYLNRQAADSIISDDPKHAAWFYFRAWCWYPLRIDRLARATLSFIRSLAK